MIAKKSVANLLVQKYLVHESNERFKEEESLGNFFLRSQKNTNVSKEKEKPHLMYTP